MRSIPIDEARVYETKATPPVRHWLEMRFVEVDEDGDRVLLSVCDGEHEEDWGANGFEVDLSPAQARTLANHLRAAADEVDA